MRSRVSDGWLKIFMFYNKKDIAVKFPVPHELQHD